MMALNHGKDGSLPQQEPFFDLAFPSWQQDIEAFLDAPVSPGSFG
jgi:hypothetical protein